MTIPRLLARLARQQAQLNATVRLLARRDAARVKPTSRPDVRLIQEIVATHYGLTVEQILGYRRTDQEVLARHMAIALACEFVSLRTTALAATFCRSHEMVAFAKRSFDLRREQFPAVETDFQLLRSRVRTALAPVPALAAA